MENAEYSFFGIKIPFFSLFAQASFPIKLIILVFIVSSIWCWAIIIDRIIKYRKFYKSIEEFEKIFWSCQSLENLYRSMKNDQLLGMNAIFMAAMREWRKSFNTGVCSYNGLQMRIDRAMNVALIQEISCMEENLSFLATLSSSAPFIGLFGTIVGIITSFQSISILKNINLSVVAPGISEALLATAIGLLTAIPALIAYNKLSEDVYKISIKLERFSDEFSNILSRNIEECLMQKKIN